jgi:hypothetical protein
MSSKEHQVKKARCRNTPQEGMWGWEFAGIRQADKEHQAGQTDHRHMHTAAALLLPLCCCRSAAAALLLPLCCCRSAAAALLLPLCCCRSAAAALLLPLCCCRPLAGPALLLLHFSLLLLPTSPCALPPGLQKASWGPGRRALSSHAQPRHP